MKYKSKSLSNKIKKWFIMTPLKLNLLLVIMSYGFYTKSMDNLWVKSHLCLDDRFIYKMKNDLLKLHPEVTHPYSQRYTSKETENLLDLVYIIWLL